MGNLSANPTVSVCMPVYNGTRFLARAFSCLRDQDFRDFDVIVADDGSTDRSADEAERLLAHYALRGTVIRSPSRGSARARDTSCESANGALIATLDCDDWWEPSYLAEMVTVVRSHPAIDLVYCDLVEEFPDGRQVLKSDVATWIDLSRADREGDLYGFSRGEFFEMLLCGQVLFPSCTVYTKELFLKTGGYAGVLPELPTSLDWFFGLRASRIATVAFLKRPLLRKRVRADSVSNTSFVKTETSSTHILEHLLRDPSLRPEERRNAVRRAAQLASSCAYESWATHKSQRQAIRWALKSLRFRWNWFAVKVAMESLIPRAWVDWARSRRTVRGV